MFRGEGDVVFHAAGSTGISGIRAAEDHDKWAIGIDSTEPSGSQNVLNSMIEVDVGVFEGTNVTEVGLCGTHCRSGPA